MNTVNKNYPLCMTLATTTASLLVWLEVKKVWADRRAKEQDDNNLAAFHLASPMSRISDKVPVPALIPSSIGSPVGP